jgi:cytochrome P450
MCCLLLFAGYETTVNLIGNGTLLLLQNPHVIEELQNDPELIPNAVQEMLRMEAPIQLTGRVIREPVECAGVPLQAGATMVVLLAGANRDPKVFPDPDRFDIRRQNAREHLAFSSGIHFCLGGRLARLEGEIAFKALLKRCRHMELAGEVPFRETAVLRAIETLPLRLRVES